MCLLGFYFLHVCTRLFSTHCSNTSHFCCVCLCVCVCVCVREREGEREKVLMFIALWSSMQAFLMRLESALHGSEPHLLAQRWEEHVSWSRSRGGLWVLNSNTTLWPFYITGILEYICVTWPFQINFKEPKMASERRRRCRSTLSVQL